MDAIGVRVSEREAEGGRMREGGMGGGGIQIGRRGGAWKHVHEQRRDALDVHWQQADSSRENADWRGAGRAAGATLRAHRAYFISRSWGGGEYDQRQYVAAGVAEVFTHFSCRHELCCQVMGSVNRETHCRWHTQVKHVTLSKHKWSFFFVPAMQTLQTLVYGVIVASVHWKSYSMATIPSPS